MPFIKDRFSLDPSPEPVNEKRRQTGSYNRPQRRSKPRPKPQPKSQFQQKEEIALPKYPDYAPSPGGYQKPQEPKLAQPSLPPSRPDRPDPVRMAQAERVVQGGAVISQDDNQFTAAGQRLVDAVPSGVKDVAGLAGEALLNPLRQVYRDMFGEDFGDTESMTPQGAYGQGYMGPPPPADSPFRVGADAAAGFINRFWPEGTQVGLSASQQSYQQQQLLQQLADKRLEDMTWAERQYAQSRTEYLKGVGDQYGPQGGYVPVPGETRGADYYIDNDARGSYEIWRDLRDWGESHDIDFWMKPFVTPPAGDQAVEEPDYNYPGYYGYGGGSYPYPSGGGYTQQAQRVRPRVDWRSWAQKFETWNF